MATQKGRNWSSGDIVTAANLSSVERGISAVSSLYEPTTWANGDTVTAAALNNIEQGIVNADGGGKTWVTLCEEEVTTEEDKGMYVALLSYSQLISADTIRVTFDGNEYICENVSPMAGLHAYGGAGINGPDFSEYPFAIISGASSNTEVANRIMTETANTHTVKIEVLQESGSSDFSTATVMIINSSGQDFRAPCPNLYNDRILASIDSADMGVDVPFEVVLYKGVGIFELPLEIILTMTVTGNVSISGTSAIITGDGTITISDSSGDTPIST